MTRLYQAIVRTDDSGYLQASVAGEVILQGELAVGDANVPLIPLWVSEASYTENDVVQYQGKGYKALTTHSGLTATPLADTTNWTPFDLRCSRIWFGAPLAAHTVGETNTSTVMIGYNSTSNISGGVPLKNDNYVGFDRPYDDAAKVYLEGFTAGDVVEYQIIA